MEPIRSTVRRTPPARIGSSVVIYTDLDGTLLDHDTYDFEPARPALERIRRRGIPLVLCSSKTRAEMEWYRQQLDIFDPFIVENGAAIFIPPDKLQLEDALFREADGFQIVELGMPYEQLVHSLRDIREETGLPLIGFSEMTVEEIVRRTGLERERAVQAQRREYSEPFVLTQEKAPLYLLERTVKRRRLNLVRGGRFYHLLGDNDKGRAVRYLTAQYWKRDPDTVTLGFGDSPNDLPLLENVDIPVLVKKPSGKHEVWRGEKEVIYTRGIGPAGWNEAIETLLPKEERHE